jgi:hypothetical protein
MNGTGRWTRRVAFGAGCVIAGIVIGFAVSRWVVSKSLYASPGSILISADQRTLTASGSGSCVSGTLDVRESPDAVVVRVRQAGFAMGPGACSVQIFSARLSAPLGSRQLIDGVTGARLPSFRGQGILRPAFLPRGFVHRYDAAFLPSGTVAGAPAGCTQVFTQGDSYDEAIWISQVEGGRWRTPAGIAAMPIVVRGQHGLAINGEIEWRQDGQLFTIQSMTYAYATLSSRDLIAIGNSLRPS